MSHLTAPTRLLVATERQCCIEDIVAVDPDGARFQLTCQGMGLAEITGPNPGCQAVDRVIGRPDKIIIQFLKGNGRNHWAENLFLNDLHRAMLLIAPLMSANGT